MGESRCIAPTVPSLHFELMRSSTLSRSWFSNLRGDLLAGIVVALALIPEAIAFSIIAGVDPKVGLYASFCIAVVIAFTGGRPGMISAATGAMALLMVDLVKDHGLQYLLAATLLTGVIQIVLGLLKVGNLMRFVSKAVMTGFVNALAILIFLAQLQELNLNVDGVSWITYAMVAGGLGIIYLLPRLTKAVPSPLVCIVVMTVLAVVMNLDVRRVGDLGQLPDTLPVFLWPQVPLNFQTLAIIFPVSLSLAVVGLLESLMTAQIVDELTDTPSEKNREARGQGIANIIAGMFGGMAGCAMIGQSVINVKSGGRTRLSTLTAGVVLLLLLLLLNERDESPDPHDLSGSIGFDASAELLEELARLDESHARLARLRGKAILEDAVKRLDGHQVRTTQRHGSVVETLDEFEQGAEWVVIGKRG